MIILFHGPIKLGLWHEIFYISPWKEIHRKKNFFKYSWRNSKWLIFRLDAFCYLKLSSIKGFDKFNEVTRFFRVFAVELTRINKNFMTSLLEEIDPSKPTASKHFQIIIPLCHKVQNLLPLLLKSSWYKSESRPAGLKTFSFQNFMLNRGVSKSLMLGWAIAMGIFLGNANWQDTAETPEDHQWTRYEIKYHPSSVVSRRNIYLS